MMKTLFQLCKPRDSAFDATRRDTVLDLSDLVDDRIDPGEFFAENYITEGMKTLLEQCFRRLEGKSSQGVFKLAEAMGGGKTHNLLALGLLAKHPQFRKGVMGAFYSPDPALGEVKVVAFSGRESDAPLGVWGAIAEQLEDVDHFQGDYAPLRAPGQKAWEGLFDGKTVLVLLDELAPYFENARAHQIGDSNLAKVTATALSNLLVALGKPSCARVCLVISELRNAYQSGSEQLGEIIADWEKETQRSAMTLEPVRLNSDELYYILRTRIFEGIPQDTQIDDVAQGYAKAIRDARQMDITNESPEQFAVRIQASYPFHPAIRDLYARFRENPGFQQTRGLIRLMRIVVSRLWQSGIADKRFLIGPHDLDFNDRETLAEIDQVNPTLENAIAHDIASDGNAVAEVMDANLGGQDTQDACKLLFMASLANVPNAVLGLSIPELVAYLAAPGRDLARLKADILEKLAIGAWYLHSTRDGKLFFKNVQNLVAKLESLVRGYIPEQAVKELRSRVEQIINPADGWCYQRIIVFPAVDEIELDQDKVTLVVTEPHVGGGLRLELREFYEQATWKNRIAFLTGVKNTYEVLLDSGKRLKAIQHILGELQTENVTSNDPQMVQAQDLSDRIRQNFHSAVRETFTQLWFPLETALQSADFLMKFDGNRYSGEQQVVDLLKEKMKFTEDVQGETFRKKCEQRLFTTQSLPWAEIKKRAGANPKWQWHHPGALDGLKADCLLKDIWREQGGYVDKGPFPQPVTGVSIREVSRDPDTGEVTLKLTPIHGDTVYYDVGGDATPASAKVDGGVLKLREIRASFLAMDSSKQHETGAPVSWANRITLKHRFFQRGTDRRLELKAVPCGTIRYTTDGSTPREGGATYDEPLLVPEGTQVVLAYGECEGVESEVERIVVVWDEKVQVDPNRPVVWARRHSFNTTRETYEFLSQLKRYGARISGVTLTISEERAGAEWIELNAYERKEFEPSMTEEALEILRRLQGNGQVQLAAERIHFASGTDLLAWLDEVRTELQPDEVSQ